MKHLLILMTFLVSFQVNASRIIEVEDYYSNKVSDFIKTRYPRKAFSVYVKVDAEESPDVREPASGGQKMNLPYLNQVSQNDVTFWDRKDVSLGTLISYLKSVFIKIDIDDDFSDEEMQKFKAELFQHLKLSEMYDRVEVNKRQWSAGFSFSKNKGLLIAGGILLLGLLSLLFLIFQSGIRSLVKGLSQPLSEIGKSAENVANSSGLSGDLVSPSSFQLANQRWEDSDLSADKIEAAKRDIQRLSTFLSEPNAELIQTLEDVGAEDPFAVGAIFAEMEVNDLQKLLQWARGEWWRVAITQSTPLSRRSIEIISKISHLEMRKNLTHKVEASADDFERILSRLSIKQFGKLLENYKFAEAEKIMRRLPQESMIQVGKYLYPGQWAELLEAKNEALLLDAKVEKKIKDKALLLCPLKTDVELRSYFRDADLLSFLDSSTTKDEREVYKALGKDSWIAKERIPFFDIFNQSKESLQQLATDLPLELWALAITSCDRQECESLYQHFSSKQKFMLREFKDRYTNRAPSSDDVVRAKKRILNSLNLIQNRQIVGDTEKVIDEAAA